MTYERREEIFSKEVLTINDIAELMSMPYQSAAVMIRNIKRRFDRLGIDGKLHVLDYFDYFEISFDPTVRYGRHVGEARPEDLPESKKRRA